MFKKIIKLFIPPIFTLLIRRAFTNSNRFKGDFKTWEDAKKETEGYDSKRLLQKIIDANRKVLNSDKFERDSVIFDTAQLLPSLNSYLLLSYVLLNHTSEFTVLDFGGSLGTVYRQFKYFTKGDIPLKWIIIEQHDLVIVGNEEFKNDELSFLDSNSWNPSQAKVDLIIVSSVLQFLREPEQLILKLKTSSAKYIILDRTPMWSGEFDVLTICIAAKYISGSYPCWFFSESKLKNLLMVDWELIGDWPALGGDANFSGGTATYKGQCWRRK